MPGVYRTIGQCHISAQSGVVGQTGSVIRERVVSSVLQIVCSRVFKLHSMWLSRVSCRCIWSSHRLTKVSVLEGCV